MRTDLGAGHTRLSPPVVVDEPVVEPLSRPIQVFLLELRPPPLFSFLRPPAVVAEEVAFVLSVFNVPLQIRPRVRSRLSAPVVVIEEAVFIAEPIRASFRVAVQIRPFKTRSVLRLPLPEEVPVPPLPPSDENLAPIIGGYGAM